MNYSAKHPAAFINVLSESGPKSEAIEWLQRTWDDYQDALVRIRELEAQIAARASGEVVTKP